MVQQVETAFDTSKITPNFIYNRADLCGGHYIVLHVQNEKNDYYLEVQIVGNHAELGIWMMKVSGREFDEIAQFVFSKYKNIEYLSFYNVISDKVFVAKNHYHVELPDSYEELERRLSAKSRNTMSRKKKKAEAEFGKISMHEYEKEKITDNIISKYFEMKKITHHIDYRMTCDEYLAKYHVSNIYFLYFGEEVAAIVLTCEQCPIVYLENLTYDMRFSKYSPGLLAYDMVNEKLIQKGKKQFYLGGGNYDYKKKYDSIETAVTEGKIYRSLVVKTKYLYIDFYNKHLRWKIKSIKERIFI